MALEYTLELVTDLSPEEALGVLSTLGVGFETRLGRRLASTGVTVGAGVKSEVGRGIIRKAFGLDTSLYLSFGLDKTDREVGLKATLRATFEILRRLNADGILLFNGESPVLMRQKGALRLNDGAGFWDSSSELLSLPQEPYEISYIEPL
jgi:hypothetical protein